MRNGTHFNKLTVVESSPDNGNDPTAHFPARPENGMAPAEGSSKPFFVLLTISIACAAASVATGSYAVWLARHQAAHQALTDVNDILRSCQSRMSQLEAELQRLPNR